LCFLTDSGWQMGMTAANRATVVLGFALVLKFRTKGQNQ